MSDRLIDRIDGLRDRLGLSDADLNRQAGLPKGLLIKARQGASGRVSLDTLERLAPVLRTTVAALIGGGTEEDAPAADPTSRRIPFLQLMPSPLNPRRTFDDVLLRELAESIAQQGLLQNLVVRKDGASPDYWIVAGERRYRALKILAGEHRFPADLQANGVPCRVIDADDADHLAIALLENLQRQDVNPMEEAEGFARLQALDPEKWKPSVIAGKIGASTRHVQQRLALVSRLAPTAQAALRDGLITFTQARHLVMVDAKKQDDLIKKAPSMTAGALRDQITRGMVPASRAIFPLASYPGQIVESPETGMKYLADPALFAVHQKAAAEAQVAELAQTWAWAELRERGTFFEGDYAPTRSDDRGVAGAIVQIDWEGKVTVHTGLLPKTTPEEKVAEQARLAAARDEHHRRETETKIFKAALIRVVAAAPFTAMALLLWDKLSGNHYQNHTLAYDYGEGLPPELGQPWLAGLTGFLDEEASNCQRLKRDANPQAAWVALRTAAVEMVLAEYIGKRLNIMSDRPLNPVLHAIAREHKVPVPAFLLPAQADLEDAIANAHRTTIADRVRGVLRTVLDFEQGDVRGPDDNDRFADDLALQPDEAADLARFLTDEFDLDQPPFIVDPHADSGGLPELGFDTVGSLIAFLEKRVAHSPKAAE